MADLTDFVKNTGSFLKPDFVKATPNEKFHVLDAGEIVKNKFGNERLHLIGMFNQEEKTFDCSKTNAKFISEKLGTDTSKWINARLKLGLFRTQRSDGVKVDAIEVIGVEN